MKLPSPLYGLVLEEEKRKTKTGDRYFFQITLKTLMGNIKCFQWNAHAEAEKDPKFPHPGDVLEIYNFQDDFEEKGSIVINAFHRTTREALPEEMRSVCDFDKASPEELKWALDLFSNKDMWADHAHHAFTMSCLAEVGEAKLLACPAATHVHHSYQGGLVVHTAEVLDICKAIYECSKKYSFINRDVLYCSAILHDIGKTQTYYINDMGVAEQLHTEKTIGHIYYGMNLVSMVHDRRQSVSKEFIEEVLHCIASHHSLVDWGSIKPVQSIESGILSRADYVSSRNGMLESVLKDTIKSKQQIEPTFKIYGDSYFASIGMKNYIQGQT